MLRFLDSKNSSPLWLCYESESLMPEKIQQIQIQQNNKSVYCGLTMKIEIGKTSVRCFGNRSTLISSLSFFYNSIL